MGCESIKRLFDFLTTKQHRYKTPKPQPYTSKKNQSMETCQFCPQLMRWRLLAHFGEMNESCHSFGPLSPILSANLRRSQKEKVTEINSCSKNLLNRK